MSPAEISSILGLLAIAFFVLSFSFATRSKRGKVATAPTKVATVPSPEKIIAETRMPMKEPEKVGEARSRLEALRMERDFLADFITRVHEARSKGELLEEHADRIVGGYRDRIKRLNERIAQNELVVKLHELEGERGKLVRDFKERYRSIDERITSLRGSLKGAPKAEERAVSPRTVKRGRERPSPAEEQVEKLIREIEKELGKLRRSEVED